MKSKPVQERYCYKCGKSLLSYSMDKFDVYTGEEIIGTQCLNERCEIGCSNISGHQWGKFWKLQDSEKCQRCGHVATYSYLML